MLNFIDKDLGAPVLRSWKTDIEDAHRSMWPGAVVPPLSNDMLYGPADGEQPRSKKKSEAVTVCTSVAFAALLHAIRSQLRDRRLRLKAFELLKAIVERACVGGLKLDVLVVDVQEDNAQWTSQTCQSPTEFRFWTDEFCATRVHFQWGADALDDAKPWVSSTSSKPHLADFIAFAVDKPSSLRARANVEFLAAKTMLEKGALSILAQLAVIMDRDMVRFTDPLKSVRLKVKKQKLDPAAKWQFVSAALDLMIKGEDAS